MWYNNVVLVFTIVLNIISLSGSQEIDTSHNYPIHQLKCTDGTALCIRYDSILYESRCEYGLMCGWSGEVTIRLIVNSNAILLSLHGTFANDSAIVNDYLIKLLYVYPYPGCDDILPPELGMQCFTLDSIAVLDITKQNTLIKKEWYKSEKHISGKNMPNDKVDALGRKYRQYPSKNNKTKLSLFRDINK